MSSQIDSLRIHARIEKISKPFNNGQWVEIKFKLDPRPDMEGECCFRVWTQDAAGYYVGQELCGAFTPVRH